MAGRGADWLKSSARSEEFVIGGFTPPGGARRHFGALLLGYHDRAGELLYAGRVGTGFDDRTLDTLHAKLRKLVQKQSPFADLSGNIGVARGVTWVKPSLVARIEFSNWTNDRHLRHPSFQGLREDKAAKEVGREAPISPKAARVKSKAKTMKTNQRKPAAAENGKAHSRREARQTRHACAVLRR